MPSMSKERRGEISLLVLQLLLESDGKLVLQPSEVKRQVHNLSKKIGIPAHEVAEVLEAVFHVAFHKVIEELDKIKVSADGKK